MQPASSGAGSSPPLRSSWSEAAEWLKLAFQKATDTMVCLSGAILKHRLLFTFMEEAEEESSIRC